MKSAIGFINLHDNPSLGKLTENRPLAAVSFLGRYGLIDFALSNMTNSGINKMEVLVQHNLDSVRSHLVNPNVWIRNTRTGFIRPVINEKGLLHAESNTDIANIMENVPQDVIREDFVVIAPPHFLYTIDYQKVFKAHSASKAGISIIYTHTKEPKEYDGCHKIDVDENNVVKAISKVNPRAKEANVSIETYIINRDVFLNLLKFSSEISNMTNSINKMVELYIKNKIVKVVGYKHNGIVLPILNLNQYINNSFFLLDNKNRKQLFTPELPVYTTTHNTPPALYGPKADVSNSFVANGAIIKGKVENSIISRDVIIEEGAKVEDCIIFSRSRVEKDTSLQYVVLDKNVQISKIKKLKGDQNDYLLIAKGAKI